MTETDLQNKIRAALSKYGVVIRNNTGVFHTPDGRITRCGVVGQSDLVVYCNGGKTVFVEVKLPTGRLSEPQKIFIDRMRELGFTAGVARSVEDAIRLVVDNDV